MKTNLPATTMSLRGALFFWGGGGACTGLGRTSLFAPTACHTWLDITI